MVNNIFLLNLEQNPVNISLIPRLSTTNNTKKYKKRVYLDTEIHKKY